MRATGECSAKLQNGKPLAKLESEQSSTGVDPVPPRPDNYTKSRQFGPTPISTNNGTVSGCTCSIC
jgi:hypothetical protein